ncbi:MAG: hypothetical protein HKN08_12005, partial [Gammaproteobacteria bacterium]|nr:hypothetical protein [Gammaproteobacteria bacterium]
MKASWPRLFVVGCIVLITVFINLPAEIVINRIKTETGLPIEWQGIEGSIFNVNFYGFSITLGSGHVLTLDQVSIQSSTLSLLSGKLDSSFDLNVVNQNLPGSSTVGLNQWRINELTGGLTIASLYPSFPGLAIFGLAGDVDLDVEQFSGPYHGLPNRGNVQIKINGLETEVINTEKPLGSYV